LPQAPTKWGGFVVLSIAAAMVTAYFPVFGAGFTNWDDDRFFTDNPLFEGPVGAYLLAALTRVQFQAYHPLHLLSYLPDRLLWPHHAVGFHALNLALFIVALSLCYFLLRRSVSLIPAFAATLLVGLSPLAVEPVAWAVGRKDVLALLLVFATLLVADREQPTRRSTIVACVLAASACLAKTSAVVLPIVLFAHLRFVRELPWRAALWRCVPFALIALAFAVPVPFIWQKNQMIPSGRPLPLALDVFGTMGIYASRVVVPGRLSPVYPPVARGQALAGLVTIAALLALVGLWRRLPSPAKFALVVFLGCLLPVANITQVYFRFADRYALLAVGMLAWPLAKLLAFAWPRRFGLGLRRLLRLLMVLVVLGQIVGEWVAVRFFQVPIWNDSLSLWQHAIAAQPTAVYGHLKLGETYREQKRYLEAAACYLRAGEIEPHSIKGPAGLLHTFGERAEAEGRIPVGATKEWEREIADKGFDGRQMDTLIETTDLTGCRSCADAMLWLGLRMFPQKDASLVRFARKALDRGRTRAAMFYLSEIRDSNTEGLTDLVRLLNQKQAQQEPGETAPR
jgi:tetratricopeptide (TPR) repeat protein